MKTKTTTALPDDCTPPEAASERDLLLAECYRIARERAYAVRQHGNADKVSLREELSNP